MKAPIDHRREGLMHEVHQSRHRVRYTEDIYADEPTRRRIGKKLMVGEVAVTINIGKIVEDLGARACRSKGGKSRDGYVAVRRLSVSETSREMFGERT